jgi:hypothetical protein
MDIAALHIEPALPGVESATFTVGLAAAIDGQETSELTAKPAALARTALRVGTPDAGTRVNPMARFLDDFDWATDCPPGLPLGGPYGHETTSVSWLLRPSVNPRSFIQW